MDAFSLTDADIKVAHALGIEPKAVAMLKYTHGRKGLAGVALFANAPGSEPYPGKRATSPFPKATDWKPSNPGTLGTEPEADADDDEVDTDENLRTAIGIVFPDGSSNRTRRKKVKK